MPSLAELQQRFAAALRDPRLHAPVASSARRFAVHRNNVAAGMAGVLEARFPAVKRLVGDEFFRAMAATYFEQHPPRSPILMLYGQTFPAFLSGFEAVADVPYLADVARLEWLQHEAYHAADAAPIGSAELAAVAPGRIAGLRLVLHPSLRLYASAFPTLTIWKMNAAPGDIAPAKLAAEAQSAVVVRPGLGVETHRVDEPTHAFVAALQAHRTLAEAIEAATVQSGGFDFQTTLARLITMGGLSGFDQSGDGPET